MNSNKNRKDWFAIIFTVAGVVFTLCMLTLLKPCGPKDDGTFMHCHDAGMALTVIALLMTAAGAAAAFTKGVVRKLLPCAEIILGALALLVPGRIISLCMMPDMRCRAVMKPGALVFAVIMILIAAADLAAGLIRKSK